MESFWLPMPSLVDPGGDWPGWGSNQVYPGEEEQLEEGLGGKKEAESK